MVGFWVRTGIGGNGGMVGNRGNDGCRWVVVGKGG